MTYEFCRIAVVDRFFASVRKDFDDPPVRFQPYPHHNRYPFDDESANGLSDSRPQFVNEKAAMQAGIWDPCKGVPHDHQRVPPRSGATASPLTKNRQTAKVPFMKKNFDQKSRSAMKPLAGRPSTNMW